MTRVYFLTGSETKMAHARYLASAFDVEIVRLTDYGKSYDEPRLEDRAALLEASFNDAFERVKKRRSKIEDVIFFLEDTSVIVNALSSKSKEVPGTDIKYWMDGMTFVNLNRLIKRRSRKVSVRSDVLLYVGEIGGSGKSFRQFTSKVKGSLPKRELIAETQSLYPWLDSKTFNRWFIPEGAVLPLSMLNIKEADKFDFRAGSILAALNFLHEKGIIKKKPRLHVTQATFDFLRPTILVVCGYPCSGKTTLGEILAARYGFYYLEASDFMHYEYQKLHGLNPTISLEKFAADALKSRPGIVVESLAVEIKSSHANAIAITGFRSPQEVRLLRQHFSSTHNISVLWVDAPAYSRFERSNKRRREDAVETFEKFEDRDHFQGEMGLVEIGSGKLDFNIINDKTIPHFEQQATNALRIPQIGLSDFIISKERPKDLFLAIAYSLIETEKRADWLTTTEIAKVVNAAYPESGLTVHKDNVSRFFNYRPSPYFRTKGGPANRFKLSNSGYAKAVYSMMEKGVLV
jgi:dephospho-CoA kinase/inosine/xanthosine triphosphate pyrophosphatase family protein